MGEPSRSHQNICSQNGSVTFGAINIGIRNQDQITLPCFQITKMEETNDLKNVVPLEQKHYFETLPSSIISKTQHNWHENLRPADGKPSFKIGKWQGEPRPSKQSRSCLWPGYKLHPHPSVGKKKSQEDLESRTEGGKTLRSPLEEVPWEVHRKEPLTSPIY